MSPRTKALRPRKGPSLFILEVTRRLRISWTRSRLKKRRKQAVEEMRRLQLMQVRMDAQLLLLQEREQQVLMEETKLRELQESSLYRMTGALPELPSAPPNPELDSLLGLGPAPDR